ncbi:hypothetical protein Tco_0211197 [Tanacetum coccineum]
MRMSIGRGVTVWKRAITTATSLEAVQDSSNIAKTQSTVTHTEPISQETSSDGGPRRQETMVVPLFKLGLRGHLNCPMIHHSEETKKVYGTAYTKLIMKVKKLVKTVKTSQARRRAKIVVSNDDIALEDFSKQGRIIEEIDQDVSVTLVTPTKVSSQEDQPEDQLRVLSAAKVLADASRVHTYSRRRRAVSTGSGRVSTASRIVSTADIRLQERLDEKESQRIARDAEVAQRIQKEIDAAEKQKMAQVHPAGQDFIKDEWEDIRARVEADEELTQKLQAEERDKYNEVNQARMLHVSTFTSIETEDKEIESELAAESSKRPRAEHDEEHNEESVKKQKLEENDAEKEELRACLDIVLGDEIAMDFESLATKYPIIN